MTTDKDEVIIEDISDKYPVEEIENNEDVMATEVKDTKEMNIDDVAKVNLIGVDLFIEKILNFPEIEEVISEATNDNPPDVKAPTEPEKETEQKETIEIEIAKDQNIDSVTPTKTIGPHQQQELEKEKENDKEEEKKEEK